MTGLFLTALAVGALVWAAQLIWAAFATQLAQDSAGPPARERVFAVAVETAVPGPEQPIMEAYGELRAARSLELRAASSGRVVELHPAFIDGGTVQAGDLLMRIDPSNAQAARDRARADLADAEAEVRDAATGLDLARDELAASREQAALQGRALIRARDLQTRGVGTAATVETAELADASARASVLARRQALASAQARSDQSATRLTRAQIAFDEAERGVADTVVTAPFSGVLSNVVVVEGRLLSGNEKAADLIDPKALEVAFRLSTAQYVRLLDQAGKLAALPVTVRLDVSGIDLDATGRISRDSAATGEGQTGRLVFASLSGTRGFKPGDFVTVSVAEPQIENVVRLPAAALNGSGSVLLLGAENRLEILPVDLVRRQGNDVLVRGAGLAGREVVTARTPLLGPGVTVRPLRREESPPVQEFVELSDERRARLMAFVEASSRMPADAKARVLDRLQEPRVPARMVERIESRMGG